MLTLILAETGARLLGYRPWQVKQFDIRVEPGGKFFQSHPALGYTNLPGQFKVTINGSYTFRATNLESTLRVTHPLDTYAAASERPEVWVFGDSVTYGWSVSDEESYVWLLQSALSDYEVVNFGVSGYGNVHSLIQLREALESKRPPKLAVLAYASWMDVRNTFIRGRRKALATSKNLGPVNQPYARLSGEGRLEIFMDTAEFKEFPLMRRSALMHALEEVYDRYEERNARSHEVTRAIFKEIIELCRRRGIELVVAYVTHDAVTDALMEYCKSEGVKTADLFVDTTVKENNNLPFDSHPSALAHRQYARKLEEYLRANVIKER
ncbi:MAG TPA: hypothetical protein VJS44_15875 [Pyrinomonadaceae bacterium]|nr:hypothetical protein [Pyrinomonadaceae bacterium]